MVGSFKLFIRTYVYWVGFILGFAIFPGYLLFATGLTLVNPSLWLAPLAGLLLLVIDRPSAWETPQWRSWLIRVLGAGFATAVLVAYVSVSARYGSRHWFETSLSLGLGWVVFAVVSGHMLKGRSARLDVPARMGRDALRAYAAWGGIAFGIFYIPATGLSAAGTLWMILPLLGTFFVGIVLLAADPPRRWPQPRFVSLWIRLLASGAAAFLFTVTSSVYCDARTHEVYIGDWQENLVFCMGAWGLYAAMATIVSLMRNVSQKP
ncbi:hypothetical protein [Alloscardovia criceti]|uniref:hypothetical protein n=1 Tax=Alloscardovia criceti TaxID=356828 RepID=UPI00037E1797|nr:hypothetical protein [Alloscardovia criceti]